MEHPPADRYDPNRLFDLLIHRFELDDDAALAHALNVDPFVVARIREGRHELDPSLLIRVNETFDINMRELRRLMGDRRVEARLTDVPRSASPQERETMRDKNEGEERSRLRHTIEKDDGGMPNFVQWS